MAYVQTSNDPDMPVNARPTGRMRWWQPLKGGRELQQEMRGEWGPEFWVSVPTVTEIKG